MKKSTILLIYIGLLFQAGCALNTSTVSQTIAVWDVAYEGEDFRNNSRPTGVILFSKETRKQDIICEEFLRKIPRISSVSSNNDLRVTYWFSKLSRNEQPQGELTCDILLENYDYDRANRLLVEINKKLPNCKETLGEGPIFVGFSGGADGDLVVIDGSTQLDDEQLRMLVKEWSQTIIQNPSLWVKAQQANGSQSAKLNSEAIVLEEDSDSSEFWSELWDTIRPALKELLAGAVPLVIHLIKGAVGIPV
jgi:hypothetical protein